MTLIETDLPWVDLCICRFHLVLCGVLAKKLGKLTVVDSRCSRDTRYKNKDLLDTTIKNFYIYKGYIFRSIHYLLWVALQYLQGLFQSLDDLFECSPPVSDMFGLAKGVQDLLVLVYPLVELRLELLLGHAHEEVANEFGNRLTHRSDCDLEDCVDPLTQLLHEDVPPRRSICLILVGLAWDWLSVLVVLLRHVIGLRHD